MWLHILERKFSGLQEPWDHVKIRQWEREKQRHPGLWQLDDEVLPLRFSGERDLC